MFKVVFQNGYDSKQEELEIEANNKESLLDGAKPTDFFILSVDEL